jgi:hypothetical protein
MSTILADGVQQPHFRLQRIAPMMTQGVAKVEPVLERVTPYPSMIILASQVDPVELAKHRDYWNKASEEVISKNSG